MYDLESKEGTDSIKVKEQRDKYNNLTTNTFTHYVFNDSLVCKVVMDSLDLIQRRVVYNYKSHNQTFFTHKYNRVYYKIKQLQYPGLSWNFVDKNSGTSLSYFQIKNYKEIKYDTIDQWNVAVISATTGIYSVTSQLELPYMKYTKPKSNNLIDSSTIIRKRENLYGYSIWLNRNLVNFSSSINNIEWLDESVDGLEPVANYWKLRMKNNKRNLKDISNGDNNVKAAIDLMNNNRLPAYAYKEFEKGNTIGRLFIINRYQEFSTDTNATSIKLDKFHELGLINQKERSYLKSAFKKNKSWDFRKKKLFIFSYLLKLELLKKEFRSMLIDNLKASEYRFNPQASEDSLFLKNRIYIDEFLSTEKRLFTAVNSKIIYCTQSNMFQTIKKILEPILIANKVEYKIVNNQPKSSLTIVSDGLEYEIDYTESIRNSIKTDPKGWYINVDYNLINNWLNSIRQLFIDQKLHVLCGVNNWIELFIPHPDVEDYYDILEQYPELQIIKGNMYVSCYREANAMDLVLDVIGIEIHHLKKDEIYDQYQLSPLVVTDGISSSDYITTRQKNAFLAYLFKYKKDFQLDLKGYAEIKEKISSALFADGHNLLEFILKINLILPRLDNGFPIITSKNEFKDVFPEISRLINFEFTAKNLKVDPLSKYILEMEYNGKIVGVEKTKLGNRHALIEFLNSHLAKKGKKIYSFQYGADWNTNYLYLKDDQKRELERILDVRI